MLSRRSWLQLAAAGVGMSSGSRWLPQLAAAVGDQPRSYRSCILLWMPGGPSQLDTFDLKPGHPNAGEFRPIDTSVPGIQISEHLPLLAQQMEHCAVIRSMQTKEGDHGRATFHLRTGYRPAGPLQYPTLGSLVSAERGSVTALPNYVSILPSTFLSPAAFGPGYLGPQHTPLVVGSDRPAPRRNRDRSAMPDEYGPPLDVRNVALPRGVDLAQADARLDLLKFVDAGFSAERPGLPTASHQAAYEQAVRLMRSPALRAFELDEEPAALRAAYGRNRFGQGCLLARRLVEQGVPFVEVALGGPEGNQGIGWDTHTDNFNAVRALSATLDAGWATLLSDLQDRGLLESTLVVWMGEFGRTPQINDNSGRDHFPNAWSTVLCGGGIHGGQVYGATSDSGMEVLENPLPVQNLLATICAALQIDYTQQHISNVGRPISIVETDAEPVSALLI